MHIDGLRRRRLALLKKKQTDLRFQFSKPGPVAQADKTGALADEDNQLSREIGVRECARKDLI